MTSQTWTPHPSLRGVPGTIRLSAGLLDRTDRQCREFVALKARPKIWPRAYEQRRYPPWESFPLGLVMAALDAVEFGGADLDEAVTRVVGESRSPVHPGVAVWVRHACHAYAAASAHLAAELTTEPTTKPDAEPTTEWDAEPTTEPDVESDIGPIAGPGVDGVELLPERLPRVVQHESPAELRMLTAWGRWYASEDGAIREFRRLRVSRPGPADAPSTYAIAFVAATGLRAVGHVYRDLPVEVRADDSPPARIRVVEVVLAMDALPRILVDATPEQVLAGYREHARPVATLLTAGGEKAPGPDCAECKLRASCDALPHTPGLLGLDGRGTHRRVWSVTTARQYQICPAQAHLRDLRIPRMAGEDSPAVRRGLVVHEWLKTAHDRRPYRPCTAADLPEPGAAGLGMAGEFMTREEYRQVRPFLLQHLRVCPLATGGITDVEAEPTMAAYDSGADVMVVAQPDLLRRVDGRMVYREQKTTGNPAWFDTDDALSRVPQLALAVCLISHGAFGDPRPADGGCVPGTVELEVMTPVSAEVTSFDAADPAVVAEARRVVTDLVRDWHRDTRFTPRPGRWCTGCPVSHWCPDRAEADTSVPIEIDGVLIDPRTGEMLGAPVEVSRRAQAVSSAITEPDLDEESPF